MYRTPGMIREQGEQREVLGFKGIFRASTVVVVDGASQDDKGSGRATLLHYATLCHTMPHYATLCHTMLHSATLPCTWATHGWAAH